MLCALLLALHVPRDKTCGSDKGEYSHTFIARPLRMKLMNSSAAGAHVYKVGKEKQALIKQEDALAKINGDSVTSWTIEKIYRRLKVSTLPIRVHFRSSGTPREFAGSVCVNIIPRSKSAGLAHDIAMYKRFFPSHWTPGPALLRHDKSPAYYTHDPSEPNLARANLFVEAVNVDYLDSEQTPGTTQNVLMFNQDWPLNELHLNGLDVLPVLRTIDIIICKTRDAVKIVQAVRYSHSELKFKIFYAGHSSFDIPAKSAKEFSERTFLHVPGKSWTKGTNVILQAWSKHPEWPALTVVARGTELLYLLKQTEGIALDSLPTNIDFRSEFLPEAELQALMHASRFHLCLSLTEGFGHYINEARSASAVVFATDAPPMNELVTPASGLLLDVARSSNSPLTYELPGQSPFQNTEHITSVEALEAAVERALAMSDEELSAMGSQARELYEQGDAFFEKRMGLLRRYLCDGDSTIDSYFE